MIIYLSLRRVRCANCHRWFLRHSPNDGEPVYHSYACGATAQPEYCASGWGFTSTREE